MSNAWATIAAGLIIGAAILLVGRWHAFAPQTGGLGIVRLDRWTGEMDVCAIDPATLKGSTVAGARLTCVPAQ
jgi:hypothetical protein